MRRPTILLTSIYYAPETFANAPYVTGLAEMLAQDGARVVVATSYPHYPQWELPERPPFASSERLNGVELRRRRIYVPHEQSAVRRAGYELSFLVAGTTALGLRRRPDAIIGVSPTLSGAVLAWAAARAYRRPYGLVFQDLAGRAAHQSEISGGGRVAAAVGRVEEAVARRARRVAVISDGFRRFFEQSGVDPARIVRLRNWSHATSDPDETRADTRARLGWSDDMFVALHSGNIGRKQGLDNLLDATAIAPGIHFAIAGDGNDRRRLEERARRLAPPNLEFLPVQPSGRYEALLRAADVLLVNQRPTVTDMSLPSRLTSYFAAGRPVVAAVAPGSETASEVEASEAGLVVPAGRPAELAAALTALRDDRAKAHALAQQGRRYAATVLSREAILEDYRMFVEQLLGRDNSA